MFNFLKKIGRNISNTIHKVGKKITGGLKKVTNFMNSNPIFNRNRTDVSNLSSLEKLCANINIEVYKSHRNPILDGYELMNLGNDATVCSYFNRTTSHMIICFRGTASLEDVKTDIEYLKHNNNIYRFNKDLQKYKEIINYYMPNTITLTAHSLGGAVCLFINTKVNNVNNVIIFNPALNFNQLRDGYSVNKRNITIIRTANDPVSVLSVLSNANIKTLPAGTNLFNSHSINSFIK